MGVKHLVLLLVAGLLCAPPASIASSVGGSEALRGKDQCEAAGRSARRGHSTVLVRRNCVEAKTAEDFFRPGPNMKSAPEGLPQPPRPSWASVAKMNIYEDDSEDAKPATPLAAFAGSGWKSAAGAFNKVWGGVAAAPAKSGEWGSAVRGGFSEGGADLAGQGVAEWPSAISPSEIIRPAPDSTLPAEGCLWYPEDKIWDLVKMTPGKTRSGGSGGITIRLMCADDLTKLSPINDACKWTATFSTSYYLTHIHRWPELCLSAESSDGELMGYIIGKTDIGAEGLFVHVTALTVKGEHRKRGIASRLMSQLEMVGANKLGALFVDLFVKEINTRAVNYYKGIGYVTSRVLSDYYDDCNALDMRKSLPADKLNRRMIPKKIIVR